MPLNLDVTSLIILFVGCESMISKNVYNFTGNESVLRSGALGAPTISIFCWTEEEYSFASIWATVLLQINTSDTDMKVFFSSSVNFYF